MVEVPCGAAPINYHTSMARIASVYYRFRSSLQSSTRSVVDLVRDADTQLAEVINELPRHLQPVSEQTSEEALGDVLHPWIPWQRWNITLVLLYHRLHINRTLQHEWLESTELHRGPRSVCLTSAQAIIHNTKLSTQPLNKRRNWYGITMYRMLYSPLIKKWQGYCNATSVSCGLSHTTEPGTRACLN